MSNIPPNEPPASPQQPNGSPLTPSDPPNSVSQPPADDLSTQHGTPQAPPAPPAPPAAPAPPEYSTPGAENPSQKTNILAILSLVFAFVFSPAGIVLGHISLNQIKKTGEGGRGLALAGTIIGYVLVALGILFLILYIAFFAYLFSNTDMMYY